MMIRWNLELSRNYILIALLVLQPSLKAGQMAQCSGLSDTQGLQAICSELRQLRLAIERANSINTQLQITLQRIQLQQGQVDRISNALESVRREIATVEVDQIKTSHHVLDFENQLQQEQDPTRQKQMREEQNYLKTVVLEERTHSLQDLRSREAEMTSSLQNEQAKLNDLDGRLDSLEKSLEPRPAQ